MHMEHSIDEMIIPKEALSLLPFKAAGIDNWNDDADLLEFLYIIYEGTGFGEYSKYQYDELLPRFKGIADAFQCFANESSPAPAVQCEELQIQDFRQDKIFGRLLKYVGAWDNVISNVLSESSFFSLSHILESRTDVDCSIHLASRYFYRQALQVIRGFLESVVMQLYFCANLSQYAKWKDSDYHTPPLRGKVGLIKQLENAGIITAEIGDKLSNIYGNLNGFIHGSESCLNHKGVGTSEYKGWIFQRDSFELWANTTSETIDIAIYLMKIHIKQWNDKKDTLGRICDICHSNEFYVIDNDDSETYTCKKCGSSSQYKKAPNKRCN